MARVTRVDAVGLWAARIVATLGALACVWAAVATGAMLVHGHPAYPVLLVGSFVTCVVVATRAWLTRTVRRRRFKVGRGALLVVGVALLAGVVWLVPSSAVEPALSAMVPDARVSVSETPTEIVLAPVGDPQATGVFFQPGARVDARAYAAVLRPLAEAGYLVVIPKQPLGIAFLATGAFAGERASFPGVTQWIVGGHSLGGTVAALDARSYAVPVAESTSGPVGTGGGEPVVGLLLYASYPANDISSIDAPVLSVSGSLDGLATPDAIRASRADLPAGTTFDEIPGGVHAFFGDYGSQAGDGEPTIAHDDARAEISAATLTFVQSVG
ncbi:alpha/beta hydrolase [Subtercola sp. Z020]|nr:alpha/beta hydrolase [Subtercola sp. Z020]